MTEALPILAILGGTGKEGPGLAMRWAKAGYKIIIGSRQLEKAQAKAVELNEKLKCDTISGLQNRDAAKEANICILTVVQTAHEQTLEELKDYLQDKILIDATARVDFVDPQPPSPPSAARIAQNILGEKVRVVAAFQNVPAHSLKKNIEQPIETDVFVCSDDITAARETIKLANAGGMQAYYAGNLDNAIVVEGLTSILISINKEYGVKTASISINGIK
ncbi:MAG: NADPH-dependent F420 reductase [Chloroflexota bacterium]